MAKLMKYRVVREHQGDRPYAEGEERIAVEADVRHLIPHVLEPVGEADASAEKAEPEPQNKAEPAAPANKAEPKAKNKAAKGV